MYDAREVFSVTPDAVDSAQYDARFWGPSMVARNVLTILVTTHPELGRYADEVSSEQVENEQAYGSGFLVTYAFVAKQLYMDGDIPEITPHDIGLHAMNIEDQKIFTEEDRATGWSGDADTTEDGIETFLNRLESSSPELADIIFEILFNNINDPAERMSFLRGAYDAFVPIYTKREAEYLYDHLVRFPSLLKSFQDGTFKFDPGTERA